MKVWHQFQANVTLIYVKLQTNVRIINPINKANLRDLIAATGLVILLKLDSNPQLISPCDLLKFDEWPRKTIRHLFYATSSFVHHFKYISVLKLELQSGNSQLGSKFVIFLSCVTLKFDGWPWKTIEHLFYSTGSFVQHCKAIGILKLQLQSGNARFGSKLAMFCPAWPWKLTDDLEKQ